MQNLDKKASVLLWSIFLSLMISSIFITLSLQINRSIKENKKIENRVKNQRTKINALATREKKIIPLDKDTTLTIQAKNTFSMSLTKGKSFTLKIGKDTNITITPKASTILDIHIGNNSFLMEKESTFIAKKDEELIITNMGGFAQFQIYSEKEIDFPYTRYSIKQKIGNKEKIIENGKIE